MRYWIIAHLLLIGGTVGCNPGGQPEVSSPVVTQPENAPDVAEKSGATASQPTPASGGDRLLELDLISLEVPTGWIRNAAGSQFLLAEFSLPGDQGDEDAGRLTISVAGGGIDENLARWRGQFVGDLTADAKSESEVNGLPVTMVDFAGTYNDRRGPFAPEVLRSDYRMLAAIVSVDGQLHFVKATGPKATIARHLEAFQAFARSVKRR